MPEHGRSQIYEKERISWNTAWMKKGGEHFEVVINPDEALEFERTKGATDILGCLRSEHVFSDAKRGEIASAEHMQKFFKTADPLAVAKILILEGEIQLSAEHRAKMREEKRNAIITHIQTYAIDPKTKLPHPRQRLELAMEEAKIKIDEKKDIQSQIADIIKKLQHSIPIRLETVTLQIHLPAPYGQKLYGDLARHGTLGKTDWLSDGSLLASLELPAGLQTDLIAELGSKTHGAAEVKRVKENPM